MKKLTLFLTIILSCFIFSACSETMPSYRIALFDTLNQDLIDYATENLENTQVVNLKLENLSISEYLLNITDYSLIEGVFVFDDEMTDSKAQGAINVLDEYNIPVVFSLGVVSEDILLSYDKAFSINVNYEYIGELQAQKIDTALTNAQITDTNENKLLDFSLIKLSPVSDEALRTFNTFVKNLELLGIPYSLLGESEVVSYEQSISHLEQYKDSELFYIIGDEILSQLETSINLTSIVFGVENPYAQSESVQVIFIDYTQMFEIITTIFNNTQNQSYPYENLEYPIYSKTIFLSPEV